ncbi:hypothetical protein OCAE111667_03995 [Occultella aeris]|uniref:Uncharacterized protein n=1 Tax=Occultella aeris TaxID=2761496 RepID=A0A7M4DDT0_9MICO|nr:hypothetical protein HALOF300_00269 [Occultella aeris]
MSHCVSTNALNVDPVWNPLEPPNLVSALKFTSVVLEAPSAGLPYRVFCAIARICPVLGWTVETAVETPEGSSTGIASMREA